MPNTKPRIVHPVSGPLRVLDGGEFVALFDAKLHDRLITQASHDGIVAMAVFQPEYDGKEIGPVPHSEQRVAVAVGNNLTVEALSDPKCVQSGAIKRYPVAIWWL